MDSKLNNNASTEVAPLTLYLIPCLYCPSELAIVETMYT